MCRKTFIMLKVWVTIISIIITYYWFFLRKSRIRDTTLPKFVQALLRFLELVM